MRDENRSSPFSSFASFSATMIPTTTSSSHTTGRSRRRSRQVPWWRYTHSSPVSRGIPWYEMAGIRPTTMRRRRGRGRNGRKRKRRS